MGTMQFNSVLSHNYDNITIAIKFTSKLHINFAILNCKIRQPKTKQKRVKHGNYVPGITCKGDPKPNKVERRDASHAPGEFA